MTKVAFFYLLKKSRVMSKKCKKTYFSVFFFYQSLGFYGHFLNFYYFILSKLVNIFDFFMSFRVFLVKFFILFLFLFQF